MKKNIEFRDEFASNPRRKRNVVDINWFDTKDTDDRKYGRGDYSNFPDNKADYDKGNFDVVKTAGYWDNGKFIPQDIANKVKLLVNKEIDGMKNKLL